MIEKQFALRRGSSGGEEAPQITPEDEDAIKRSRLTAARSTSTKIAGLKIGVTFNFFLLCINRVLNFFFFSFDFLEP